MGDTTYKELSVEYFRAAFGALSTGDLSVLRSMYHHDVEWHLPGNPDINPHCGIYKGADEVESFLLGLIEASSGTLEMPVHDVLTRGVFEGGLNGRHSVVIARAEARRGDRVLSSSDVIVFHIRGDAEADGAERLGLICWFPEDQYGADQFWA